MSASRSGDPQDNEGGKGETAGEPDDEIAVHPNGAQSVRVTVVWFSAWRPRSSITRTITVIVRV